MAEGEECSTMAEWKERCFTLEGLLFKFRQQIIKIRQLTAEKLQQMETQVLEAERRTQEANQQVQWMEECLQAGMGAGEGDGEGVCADKKGVCEQRLLQRCQDLQSQLHQKDQLITTLETQLEEQRQMRVQESKIVEEKAAKIKEWVMLKLQEFEVENAGLKETNLKQEAQIQALQNQLQAAAVSQPGPVRTRPGEGEAHRLSSVTFGCFQVRAKNPRVLCGPHPPQTPVCSQTDPPIGSTAIDAPSPGNELCVPPKHDPRIEGDPNGNGTPSHPHAGTVDPPNPPRPSSEAYLTASDDSSSLFDEDMQRSERPTLRLRPRRLCPGNSADDDDDDDDDDDEEDNEDDSNHSNTNGVSHDDLNQRFKSQCLDSSSSSSFGDVAVAMTTTPSIPGLPPSFTPKRPTPHRDAPHTSPASPKQPRLRTPASAEGGAAGGVSLAKRHLSQPSFPPPPLLLGLEEPASGHTHSHTDTHTQGHTHKHTRNAISMLRPPRPQETDLDLKLEDMETVAGGGRREEEEEEREEEVKRMPPVSPESSTKDLGGPQPLPGSPPPNKPPTPPLHRFPSWESRIYAVAKSGISLSESFSSDVATKDAAPDSSHPASHFYSSLIYKSANVPTYTTLKGRATLLSSDLSDECCSSPDEGSSEESCVSAGEDGSLRSSHTSNCSSHKGSPRTLKRGVSMSSVTSESDYAIPPDAYSTDTECSEPEHKLPKTCTHTHDAAKTEPMEKSGYLLKMVKTWKKTWRRRWFVLKDGELLYYKSPSDVIRKPQGQIELTASSSITRGDGKQMLQVVTGKRVYSVKADSPNLLGEWLRVLQSVVRIKAASPLFTQPDARPIMKGHLTKVAQGSSKRVWCALYGKTLYYFRAQEDKFPLGQIRVWEACISEVEQHSGASEAHKGALQPEDPTPTWTISLQPPGQASTQLVIQSQQEKVAWLYHLSVAAGKSGGHVGTEFEQLVGKLVNIEGDAGSQIWRHPMLCFSKEALPSPLTTLPSRALQTEAVKLFKTCQLFINVAIDAPAIDYHISLAQSALQVCVTHPELQSELYCQLIKQTTPMATPTPTTRQPISHVTPLQGWQFLALCVGLFLPHHPFLWLLQLHLNKHADTRSEGGKYAIYCQRCVERTLQRGERQARPSRMEILSLLLRNPYHHSLPFSVPVHFINNTYQVVSFDASTTVEEFQSRLIQDQGVRKSSQSGFSLYSDDPAGHDIEHYLQGDLKICDIIAKWEEASKNTGKSETSKSVRFTFKNRLYFSQQVRGETERERLLLAYQTSDAITAGHFPVNKDLALEMAALLAQVEFGDCERPLSPVGSTAVHHTKSSQSLKHVLDKFYPKHYRNTLAPDQLRQLSQKLCVRWSCLRGRSAQECVRIYLTVARKWPYFGAKLFDAEPVSPSKLPRGRVWIAAHEEGISILEFNSIKLQVSLPMWSVMSFGANGNHFMINVTKAKDTPPDKHLFAMATSKVRELTLLIAAYTNYAHQQKMAAHHLSAPALLLAQPDLKRRDLRPKSPPTPACRPSKAPTLL